MEEESKISILEDLNNKIGGDLKDLDKIKEIRNEYLAKREKLQKCLSLANSEVPSKVSAAIKQANDTLEEIYELNSSGKKVVETSEEFIEKHENVIQDITEVVERVRKLEAAKEYFLSLQDVQKISQDLSKCNDIEQSVLYMQKLYEMKQVHSEGYRGTYITETCHYWYNILKEKFSKEFEEVLKLICWPFVSSNISVSTNVAPEHINKFKQLSQFLFQIQLPEDLNSAQLSNETEISIENSLCLPIRLMIKPLKKRFKFHFSGNRKTNRLDRPEWFMTQILAWLRDHQPFLLKHLQPVVKGLDMKIDIQQEFACGLMQLAVDKFHSLLASIIQDDNFFSHAIDECLGFERELNLLLVLPPTCPRVISVLTNARYLVRWLEVEKKFAIQKIDEMLSGEEWLQPISNSYIGETDTTPQGADWLVSLLQTVHDRYSLLPRPGHRLQFLELQIELCEELRLRLTQMVNDELQHVSWEGGQGLEAAPRLLAMLNVTNILKQVLIDWSHSVPYLQLHYYKKQFNYFTELQHVPIPDVDATPRKRDDGFHIPKNQAKKGSILLDQVETDACVLAQKEMEHFQQEHNIDCNKFDEEVEHDSGVFEEIPSLLGRLVDGTCSQLCDDLVMEVKAASRDYKKQKWHCLPEEKDWKCRSLSPALCIPLGKLTSRLSRLHSALASDLFAPLWRNVASDIDSFIFEEVVSECWWALGGAQQLQFDMTRNLMVIFAQYTSTPEAYLPKIKESCTLLNLPIGSGILLKEAVQSLLNNDSNEDDLKDCAPAALAEISVRHLSIEDALHILNRRTDISLLQRTGLKPDNPTDAVVSWSPF